MRNRFQHMAGQVTGGGQSDPRIALVMGDTDKAGEPGPGGGQVCRTLAVIDAQPERPATGRESARYVVVHPDRCRPGGDDAGISDFHASVSPSDIVLPKIT